MIRGLMIAYLLTALSLGLAALAGLASGEADMLTLLFGGIAGAVLAGPVARFLSEAPADT